MIKKGSPETIRKTTFNFNEFKKAKPEHLKTVKSSFLEWFIGFVEGNGFFIVSNKKLFFILNQKEAKVLYFIRKNLGFGKVSLYKEFFRFIVADKKHIDILILLFNGNLVLNKTNAQFESWLQARNTVYHGSENENDLACKRILNDISNVTTPFPFGCLSFTTVKQEFSNIHDNMQNNHLFGNQIIFKGKNQLSNLINNSWLSGFIDAEGCFNAQTITEKRYSLGFTVRLRFIVYQKNENDILKQIKFSFKSGCITPRLDVENMFRYTCTDLQALQHVISYLQKHPLHTLKKVSFFRFHKLLRYITNRKQQDWTGKVLTRIKNLLKNLNSGFNKIIL